MKKCLILNYFFILFVLTIPHVLFSIDYLLEYRKSPAVKAFLDTIAYAEDTFYKPNFGYNVIYTGATFKTFHDHPRIRLCAQYKGKPLCATAAGRYMFLQKTWDKIAPKIGATDFSPVNQDRAAIKLILERNAIKDIKAGKFEVAVEKVNTIWATFPNAPYGQTVKPMANLKKFFNTRLNYYKNKYTK